MATPLEIYKSMRVADIQVELERRVNATIPDYTMRKAMRRGLQLLGKGSTTQAEKNELAGYSTQFATIDPIEAAAQAAKDRINALTSIPDGDDAFLLQW